MKPLREGRPLDLTPFCLVHAWPADLNKTILRTETLCGLLDRKEKNRKDSAGNDDTASMIKGAADITKTIPRTETLCGLLDRKEEIRKDSTGSDGTASMIKGASHQDPSRALKLCGPFHILFRRIAQTGVPKRCG